MNWDDDWRFRRLADVLWRADMRLAQSRRRGHVKAWRTMQARYEGFSGLRSLARIREDLAAVVNEMKAVLG
jgi:hypothetical protein